MGDAPTTEEVREETERLRRELDGAAFERGSNERARRSSAERAMSAYALPIAEHRDALAAALAKIDAIRNSIIGRQGVNWSAHIYPLVAALDEAGYGGEGYEVARPKAEAERAALRAVFDERDALAAEVARLRPLAELGALVLGPNDLPGLINALLRLCTHAQLGEVVVPRRAGEWERELWVVAEWTARTMPGFGIVGRVRPGGDGEGAWVALSWRIEGQHVGPSTRTEHPTRAEAEAAVDDRLRADGVVLP